MYNPVPGRLLSDPLLHECLLASEQLHGQLVVRGLEQGLQLVPHEPRLRPLGNPRPDLLFRRPVQADVVLFAVPALLAVLEVHLGRDVVVHQVLIVGGDQRVGAGVRVVDVDLDGVLADGAGGALVAPGPPVLRVEALLVVGRGAVADAAVGQAEAGQALGAGRALAGVAVRALRAPSWREKDCYQSSEDLIVCMY